MTNSKALYNFLSNVKKKGQGYKKHYPEACFSLQIIYRSGKKENVPADGDFNSLNKAVYSWLKAVFEEPASLIINIREKPGGKSLYPASYVFNEKSDDEQPAEQQNTFRGFGEAQVREMIEKEAIAVTEKRLREMEQAKELETLRKENAELKEENTELKEENEKLGELMDRALSTESLIKGIAGILGQTGFHKVANKIDTALAGFLGAGNSDVEEVPAKQIPESDRRKTIIELITSYVDSLSDTQLVSVFNLLSEIEAKPDLLNSIEEFIKTTKEDKTHE